jgi:uncharacterized membrane protein YqgA involved in biofilm formation
MDEHDPLDAAILAILASIAGILCFMSAVQLLAYRGVLFVIGATLFLLTRLILMFQP